MPRVKRKTATSRSAGASAGPECDENLRVEERGQVALWLSSPALLVLLHRRLLNPPAPCFSSLTLSAHYRGWPRFAWRAQRQAPAWPGGRGLHACGDGWPHFWLFRARACEGRARARACRGGACQATTPIHANANSQTGGRTTEEIDVCGKKKRALHKKTKNPPLSLFSPPPPAERQDHRLEDGIHPGIPGASDVGPGTPPEERVVGGHRLEEERERAQ